MTAEAKPSGENPEFPRSPRESKSFWREWISLFAFVVITGGIWLFAEIADEVAEGDTHGFDRKVLLAMRDPADTRDPWGPKWLEEMGRDFTALGGMGILLFLTAATVGGYMLQGRHKTALLILIAVLGGLVISLLLKQSFDRPRPDLVPHGSYVYTKSFPSGHSMLSAIAYLTLGSMIVRTRDHRATKVYVMSVTMLITLLVGISRIYLGVHWPTDVLAGWAAGASWALICWLAARWLQKRGHVL
ncbi:MAG: phosphatase PAP2 family protein [Phycisphaerales bacterium]|nr:MAG: phosphatase PAP2 family protein [Phycisphaerales bacterium]